MIASALSSTVTFAVIDEPPFCFPTVSGGFGGYDVEVALAVLARAGYPDVGLRLVTFADLLPGVMAGRWRLATPLFITPERAACVSFSRIAGALSDGLLVRKAIGAPTSYAALGHDPTLRLAVIRGQVQEQSALSAGVSAAQILRVATPEEAVAAVAERRADACAGVAAAHRGFLARRPDPALGLVDLAAAGAARAKGAYVFGAADDTFRAAFDRSFDAFRGSADHRTIMRRHRFSDADIVLTPGASG